MNKTIPLAICLLALGCSQTREGEVKPNLLSHFVSISDNEDRGVNAVLDFYGGYCEYSVGKKVSTESEDNYNYFTLTMSKSGFIDQNVEDIENISSNICYLFFNELGEEEENYDFIGTIIQASNGEKRTFQHSKENLKIVQQKIQSVKKVLSLISEGKQDSILEIISPSEYYEFDKTTVIKKMIELNGEVGSLQDFQPRGFVFYSTDSENLYLKITGAAIRSIQNHEFSAHFHLKNGLELIDFNK